MAAFGSSEVLAVGSTMSRVSAAVSSASGGGTANVTAWGDVGEGGGSGGCVGVGGRAMHGLRM